MKKLTSLTVLLIFSLWGGAARSQSTGQVNYHSGNKLRITFSNAGEITAEDNLGGEWPVGTGQEYLNSAFPVVAVENDGQQRVASFVFNDAFSGAGRVAMSHVRDSWPASWPERPASWDGFWNGYFGRGRLTADQESFFVLEDPSLGLRLTVRGWQWSHYLAQDMIFWYYELTNIGSSTYDRAAMGFFVDPDVGGDGDQDVIMLDPNLAEVTALDPDNIGHGRGVAQGIGAWSPVARFSAAVLETPGLAGDGIDNDHDGLVDESRSDGIDNDGDWNPATDDVGADGVAGTGDQGEGDGVPTAGEPNFDATDVDESDQIGLTSFAEFPEGGFSPSSAGEVWAALSAGRFDSQQGAGEFVLGSGGFSLAPGETQRFSVVLFLSVNPIDQKQNEAVVQEIYSDNYRFPIAPPRPKVTAVALNKGVTLYWDNSAEQAPDFEGYKIYRSTDPGFNDVFTVTNDRGIVIYSQVMQTFDLKDNISNLFGLQADGFRYFLGKDTGLRHWFTDTNVDNGKTYYYAVVAFDHGDVAQRIFPTESPKSIIVEPSGNVITDVNTAVVTPRVETSVFQSPDFSLEHTSGVATGRVEVEIIDRTKIRDGARYQVTFVDSPDGRVRYSLFDVTDPNNPVAIVENSGNYSTDEVRNDADPNFDGVHVFLFDEALAWDEEGTTWKVGDSNWDLRLAANGNLGAPVLEPVDYEVRFGEVGVDTALFTTPIPVPFEVWNITENKKENILVLDQNGDGAWNSGENIFVVTGTTLQDFRPVKWTITITAPRQGESIPPESGDVALFRTFKPFSTQDVYKITTKAFSARTDADRSVLHQIAVVPNPYIVSSGFEQLSLYTGGQLQRKLEFIHLPPKCKIRIYDLRGRLLDTIVHDSTVDDGSEFWDLSLGDNNEVVAYGIYIYHVQAEGLGEKIGRFAIIR